MPAKRLIKNCTRSSKVNKLSADGEVFFYRLVQEADDYGNYDADPKLLKAGLYPIKELTEADIVTRMIECFKVGLVFLYRHKNHDFVHIPNFDQKVRSKPRFPQPDNEMVLRFLQDKEDAVTNEGVQSAYILSTDCAQHVDSNISISIIESINIREREKPKPSTGLQSNDAPSELVLPFEDEIFKGAWHLWKKYKKDSFRFKYKTQESEQAALKGLSELAAGDLHYALHLIEFAIKNQWKGFYHDKDYEKQTSSTGKKSGFNPTTVSELYKESNRTQEG